MQALDQELATFRVQVSPPDGCAGFDLATGAEVLLRPVVVEGRDASEPYTFELGSDGAHLAAGVVPGRYELAVEVNEPCATPHTQRVNATAGGNEVLQVALTTTGTGLAVDLTVAPFHRDLKLKLRTPTGELIDLRPDVGALQLTNGDATMQASLAGAQKRVEYKVVLRPGQMALPLPTGVVFAAGAERHSIVLPPDEALAASAAAGGTLNVPIPASRQSFLVALDPQLAPGSVPLVQYSALAPFRAHGTWVERQAEVSKRRRTVMVVGAVSGGAALLGAIQLGRAQILGNKAGAVTSSIETYQDAARAANATGWSGIAAVSTAGAGVGLTFIRIRAGATSRSKAAQAANEFRELAETPVVIGQGEETP